MNLGKFIFMKSISFWYLIGGRKYHGFSMATFSCLIESYWFPFFYTSQVKMLSIMFMSKFKPDKPKTLIFCRESHCLYFLICELKDCRVEMSSLNLLRCHQMEINIVLVSFDTLLNFVSNGQKPCRYDQ